MPVAREFGEMPPCLVSARGHGPLAGGSYIKLDCRVPLGLCGIY
jgi:hypothetical protein